jgi:DNA-directed RNA polymerase subunit F
VRGAAGPEAAGTARAFARRLAGFEEGELRAHAAARLLAELAPDAAADLLAALARSGEAGERAAWAAVGQAMCRTTPELPYAWRAELYAIGAERGLLEVTGLLVAPPPRRVHVEPRDKADPRLAHLTLGHKRALARARRDPDLLARLAAEGDPTVVRELLRNPQLTEEFVVRIAARRPIRPATLRCLFEARRWRTRPAVALAIARNPYVETEIALEILPFLAGADLADVAQDGTVHPLVRALAARLAAARAGRARPATG